MKRLITSSTIVLALMASGAGQAFAHAHLTTTTPAANSTVSASPTELDLKFSEDLNLKFSGVKVLGPDKKAVQTGQPMLMDGDTTLMVPLTSALAPGAYTVQWHALSKDGHKTHGDYTFTVKP
ncbi:MAG: copper homeostasis periplasmic binding protein CopC [Hyphomicrobiales bacterium]